MGVDKAPPGRPERVRLTLHIHLHVVVPDAVWLRAADGTLTVIDLTAPSDDDVATLARKVCQNMTAVVDHWQEARGEAEPPEHANELTSLVMADLGIAAPRIDEELAPNFWRDTRARIPPEQLASPLCWFSIPDPIAVSSA